MPYEVRFRPSARKELDKLPNELFARIAPRIDQLAQTPRPPGLTKLSGHQNLYRIRVGDYRIVYEVPDDQRVVIILIVAHRRESYRGI